MTTADELSEAFAWKRDAPAFFRTYSEAEVVRDLLFKGWTGAIARVEDVEVIERNGCLIEARYA